MVVLRSTLAPACLVRLIAARVLGGMWQHCQTRQEITQVRNSSVLGTGGHWQLPAAMHRNPMYVLVRSRYELQAAADTACMHKDHLKLL